MNDEKRPPHAATMPRREKSVGMPSVLQPHPATALHRREVRFGTFLTLRQVQPGASSTSRCLLRGLEQPAYAVQAASATIGSKTDFTEVTNQLDKAIGLAVERARHEFLTLQGGWEGWFQVEVAATLEYVGREEKREVKLESGGRSDFTVLLPKTSTTVLPIHIEIACQNKTNNDAKKLHAKMLNDANKYKGDDLVILVAACDAGQLLKDLRALWSKYETKQITATAEHTVAALRVCLQVK